MIRTLTAAALTMGLAAPALSQDAATPMFDAADLEYGETYLATTLIGQPIHAVEEEYEMGAMLPAGTSAEWDRVGEIGDMIIGVDGSLQAVILDIGGFLGLGEREVAIRWDALRPVYEDGNFDNWLLTVPATEEMLESAPEVDRNPSPAMD
ncbi:MAG: PRC-barrel domain-containing protein [Paracoccaceae bacterium]